MASAETLMRQAGMTADYWMQQAIESIDARLGEGYASKHPELISGFIIAASNDQKAMHIKEMSESLSSQLDKLTSQIEESLFNDR